MKIRIKLNLILNNLRNNLKAALAMSLEYPEGLIESISLSPENAAKYSDFAEVSISIDNVSADEVNAVRKNKSIYILHFDRY
jgi:hypothetical protein